MNDGLIQILFADGGGLLIDLENNVILDSFDWNHMDPRPGQVFLAVPQEDADTIKPRK
jgi:hypothetical protein